ncbi:MAG: hypothetical protein ACXQTS_03690 [Candidatus Methanospirareceae archaeon]
MEDIFPERFFDLRKKCKTGTATSEEKIHHKKTLNATGGWINCTAFVDANNRKHDDWIPAFKLFCRLHTLYFFLYP